MITEQQQRELNYMEGQVKRALEHFWANDRDLITVDIHERTLSGRLVGYLKDVFEGWDVDPEYNKHGDENSKVIPRAIAEELGLPLKKRRGNRRMVNGRHIVPDIIVHHRRGKIDNLLVIEVKKSTSKDHGETDVKKLKALTRPDSGFVYPFGLRLIISMDGNAEHNIFEWYIGGERVR